MTQWRSRVVDDASQLLFADLHNHSLFSDGRGDPEQAFAQLRAAGLDVAALTDHAAVPHDRVPLLDLTHYPHERALALGRNAPFSIAPEQWDRLAEIADAHDVPGEFTAIRGFEWTDQWMGHVNVWLGETFTQVTTPGSLASLRENLRDNPQALFGYNHPGREPGCFDGFDHVDALTDRMVGLELFNRSDDYLFSGWSEDGTSAVVSCLDSGWRPGVLGSSDEHGTSYGLVGKGRTGLWAPEHSRTGVRAALAARSTFATREVGLRLDATLDGVRMGSAVTLDGTAELAIDIDGSELEGSEVELQVLTGDPDGLPLVVHTAPAVVGDVTRIELTPPADAGWLMLRVADPTRPSLARQPSGHAARGWALAYASPWWLH